MERQERAELAVRLTGLAVLVNAAVNLISAIVSIGLLAETYTIGAPTVAYLYAVAVLQALVGVGLLACPGAASGIVGPRGREAGDSGVFEFLRLGMFALAVWCFVHALGYVSQPAFFGMATAAVVQAVRAHGRGVQGIAPPPGLGFYYAECYLTLAAWALAGAVFLARPRRLTVWLGARVQAGEGWSLVGALGAGLALIGLYNLARDLATLAHLRYWLGRYSTTGGWSNAASGGYLLRLRAFVNIGLGGACWLFILAFSGRLGRWLARGAPQSLRPVLSALGKESAVEVALPVGVLWALLAAMMWVLDHAPLADPVLQWGMAAVAPVGIIAIVTAVGRWAPRSAHVPDGHLHAQPTDRAGLAGRDAAHIALEVAITTVAIFLLADFSLSRPDDLSVVVPWLLTLALLLALRGDIAQWCVRTQGRASDAKERRRAALYPWLSVLGVVVVVSGAPGLAVSALSSAGILPEAPQSVISAAFDERPRSLPWPQLAAGLLLIFARRPLSRLLAYGPLLHGNGGVGHGLTSD